MAVLLRIDCVGRTLAEGPCPGQQPVSRGCPALPVVPLSSAWKCLARRLGGSVSTPSGRGTGRRFRRPSSASRRATAPSLATWERTGARPMSRRGQACQTTTLAYHVAHELAHMLLRARDYPVASPGADVPPSPEAARVSGDLQGDDRSRRAVSEILGPFGFSNDFILDRTAAGAAQGLSSSPVPEPGTAWFATWAIRYCDLSRDLGAGAVVAHRIPVQGAGTRPRRAGRTARRNSGVTGLRLPRQGAVGDAGDARGPRCRSTGSAGHRPGGAASTERGARLPGRLGDGLDHGLDVAVGEGPARGGPTQCPGTSGARGRR